MAEVLVELIVMQAQQTTQQKKSLGMTKMKKNLLQPRTQ
jgi:hypothetical protein